MIRWTRGAPVPRMVIAVGAAIGMVAVGVGIAVAADGRQGAGGAGQQGDQVVVCPAVADRLPAMPAAARAEVDRNLALLDTQVAEANQRLVTSRGQGGPNFVANAILGPLADKRRATLDRIAIAIGRHAERPAGLETLAGCALGQAGAGAGDGNAGNGNAGNGGAGNGGAGNGGAGAGSSAAGGASAPAQQDNGAGGNGAGGGAAAGQTIVCPTVADRLPAVPAAARAEVDRNLALLDTQVAEANQRLVTSRGQGGPNFVANAILGPLADKRRATLDRIAIAIGRHAERPAGLETLAGCALG